MTCPGSRCRGRSPRTGRPRRGRPAARRASAPASCPPSLVAPLRELDRLELERLLVQDGFLAHTRELPRRDVRELVVVAERFAVLGLVLDPEVPAAALLPVQGVEAHELGDLAERGAPSRLHARRD